MLTKQSDVKKYITQTNSADNWDVQSTIPIQGPMKVTKLRRKFGRRKHGLADSLLHKRHAGCGMLRAHRERLAHIAQDTYTIVLTSHGYYEDPLTNKNDNAVTTGRASPSFRGTYHDLSNAITRSRNLSAFYPHSSTLLGEWEHGPPLSLRGIGSDADSFSSSTSSSSSYGSATEIEFTSSTAYRAAHKAWNCCIQIQHNAYGLGMLNPASPKKPGGASLNGGVTLEECLARQTTLIDSLKNSSAAREFYAAHRELSDGSGLHDHAMLYSPYITAFKDERGIKVAPITINVVSAIPVHAGTARSKAYGTSDEELREEMRSVMHQRMARILRLFEERGDRVLILGAFGVGQCSNSPEMIGEIWAELLHVKDAKYQSVFDKVIFSVPSKYLPTFERAFNARVLESELISEFEES